MIQLPWDNDNEHQGLIYKEEVRILLEASLKAAKVAEKIFLDGQLQIEVKSDASPVTVADFCCQIIIENAIKDVFPNELIIAEEDCEYSETIHNYLHSVDPALATKLRCNFEPSEDIEEVSTKEYYRIPEKLKAESMCIEEVGVKEINIKEGCCAKHETNSRYWVIDPIDGTKGYISNKNYAICSALIVNEMVQASVLVCPRMLAGGESNKERMQVGTAFFAIRGHCAYQMCLQDFSYSKLPLPEFEEKKNRNPKNLVITESAESSHTDYALSSRLLLKLSGFTDAKYYEGSNEIFLKQFKLEREEIDKRKILAHSQCKYGLVARGDADVYVRRARRLGHEECIWDHAPGSLIVEEAGGTVTDFEGNDLIFKARSYFNTGKGGLLVSSLDRRGHNQILSALKELL